MLDPWIFVFPLRLLCVCKPGGTPQPQQGLTVHVGRPEGPNGGGPLPARGQHLHLQAVEGGGPQTRDRELGVILGKGREGVGEHGPSGAASDHDPRRDSPPETTPPHDVTVLHAVRSLGLHCVRGSRGLSTFAGDHPPSRVLWAARRPRLLAAKSSDEPGQFLALTPAPSRGRFSIPGT